MCSSSSSMHGAGVVPCLSSMAQSCLCMHVHAQVSYYYDPDIGDYYYGHGHPMKPHRVRMAHNLIVRYGLYNYMEASVVMTATQQQQQQQQRQWPVTRLGLQLLPLTVCKGSQNSTLHHICAAQRSSAQQACSSPVSTQAGPALRFVKSRLQKRCVYASRWRRFCGQCPSVKRPCTPFTQRSTSAF